MHLWFLCASVILVPLLCDARISKRYVIGCPERCDRVCVRPYRPTVWPETPWTSATAARCARPARVSPARYRETGRPRVWRGSGVRCVWGDRNNNYREEERKDRRVACVRAPSPCAALMGVSYKNICELKRVSNRAQKLQQPGIIFIQRGACGKGKTGAPNCLHSLKSRFFIGICSSMKDLHSEKKVYLFIFNIFIKYFYVLQTWLVLWGTKIPNLSCSTTF